MFDIEFKVTCLSVQKFPKYLLFVIFIVVPKYIYFLKITNSWGSINSILENKLSVIRTSHFHSRQNISSGPVEALALS